MKRLAPLLFLAGLLLLTGCRSHDTTAYREKADALKAEVLTEDVVWELGLDPAGEAGHAVFLSVCDKVQRAEVFTGVGETLEEAWNAADRAAEKALKKSGREALWVKVDVVYDSVDADYARLCEVLSNFDADTAHYGVAFDKEFRKALLEAEMNSNEIFRYGSEAGIDREALNEYLKATDRKKVKKLPEEVTVFQCIGWMCEEKGDPKLLSSSGSNYGRRTMEAMDGRTARTMAVSATNYLISQLGEDGAFAFSTEADSDNQYSMVRHASVVWGLLNSYRLLPREETKAAIDSAISHLLTAVVYDGPRAYLYEEAYDEYRLGGSGLAVAALTAYMELFSTDEYLDVCIALCEGILSMQQENGQFIHVLNGDFTTKDEFRTIYYDGEAVFGLCKFRGYTGEFRWLEAASLAAEHFVAADYTQYTDHWAALAMNELIRYVENPDFYMFTLRNAQKLMANLENVAVEPTTAELLLVAFDSYVYLADQGVSIAGFDHLGLIESIQLCMEQFALGFVYPEQAMYLDNPGQMAGSYMQPGDTAVRIDTVQHFISSCCMFNAHYDLLDAYSPVW